MSQIKMLRHFFLILIMVCMINENIHSQETLISDPGKSDYLSNTYRLISVGLILPNYIDFATSPLSYSGWGPQVSISYLKRSARRERIFEIAGSYSPAMRADIPFSDFIQPSSGGNFARFNARYQRLWRMNKLSDKKNNVKF
ncbi:MAG: hypothetical protein ACKO1T_05855, partial [Sediminibacterium sp.]